MKTEGDRGREDHKAFSNCIRSTECLVVGLLIDGKMVHAGWSSSNRGEWDDFNTNPYENSLSA